MSRVNVMELFEKASSMPQSQSIQVGLNGRIDLESMNCDVEYSKSQTIGELPEFLSESTTISLVPSPLPPNSRRLVAAGGQYLFLARTDSLWVLDMNSGVSNDRKIQTNLKAISDMEFNANSSFLVFTDGIDVGIIKCLGINGNHVQLSGAVYLREVGTETDPIVQVKWHPINMPSFATLRNIAGWTLWDLVRLQSKMSADFLEIDEKNPNIPSLFRGEVKDALSLSEGTYPWVSASNTIAGKRVSPGVMAILRRGDATPQKRNSGGSLNAFQFSADGSLAIASVGDSLKVWSIGLKCSTVNSASEESIRALTEGREIKSILALERNIFAMLTESALIQVSVADTLTLIRCVRFSGGLSLEHAARLAFISRSGDRENAVAIVAQTSGAGPVLVLVDSRSLTVSSVHAELEKVSSLAVTPTVGNPRQFAIYMHGQTAANSRCIWTAQSLDTQLMDGEKYEEEKSVSSSAPDRIESTTEFGVIMNPPTPKKNSVSEFLKAAVVDEARRAILQSDIGARMAEKIEHFQQRTQDAHAKEIRRLENQVTKTVKEKFGQAMRSLMEEVSGQLEAKLEARFSALMEIVKRNNKLHSDQLDGLISKLDGAIQNASYRNAGEPAALFEIRKQVHAGDHIQAIASAAQWWKLNQPLAADQPDLLAIACALIAAEIKPAAEILRDVSSGCYVVLVLTEWAKTACVHADRIAAVLRVTRYVLACLLVTPIHATGEMQDLCSKSLSKSVRNAAAIAGTNDRIVEDLARDTLIEVREVMMKFSISRESTPRAASSFVPSPSPGGSILQMVQAGRRQ